MRRFRLSFSGDPLSRLGLGILVGILGVGLLGATTEWFGDPARLIGAPLRPPTASEIMGTDNLGRSLLARTVAGAQQSVLLSTTAVLIAICIGSVLGMLAGYFRGLVDEVICRLADAMYSFPAVVMAILISAVIRPGSSSAIAAVVLVTLPIITRMIRAATLSVAGQEYVVQARIMGAHPVRILTSHIFPNILGAVAVQAAYSISFGMIIESSISFLGLGVQPPSASLGSLVYEGRPYLALAPTLVFFPGIVLMLTILSINLVGDGLRRVIDAETVI